MSSPTVEEAAAAVTPPLTLSDRCDRCGAAAKIRAVYTSGDLLFCGHHAHEYKETLTGALLVLDG